MKLPSFLKALTDGYQYNGEQNHVLLSPDDTREATVRYAYEGGQISDQSYKSYLADRAAGVPSYKALTSLAFNRGSSPNAVGAPFFGQNFELWDQYWRDGGRTINYEREVGDLRTSALLMAAYTWVSRSLSAARLTVVSIDSDNKETEIQNHPLVEKFDQPNEFYGGEELWSGVALSWLCVATAYILKVRNRATGIAEFWYEPWWSIRPTWPEDGSKFIGGYQINRNGYWLDLAPEDVLVFRNGIDPDTRMGQSASASLVREYYTDRQAAEFAALLMKQGLVPPIVASLGDKDRAVSRDEMVEFKGQLLRVMSGGSAGEPVVVNAPATVNTLNYDYGKIGLRDVRAIPEERFCAAMGISPYSLHFGTSRQASTFSNVENYLKHDYRSYIVPLHNYIAKRIAREILPEFQQNTDNIRVKWNYDEVPLMQSDQTVEWRRVAEAYKARILDQAEAREAIGYKSDDSHIGIYYPVQGTHTTENELEMSDPETLSSTLVNGFDEVKPNGAARPF
jgi:HK97 family phage portal protein